MIISELQGGENDPEQLLDTEVTAAAFKVHPYHHPTIGWLSDLQTMTRDDLYGHYRRYYVPSNATLVIVGDVDTDDALKQRREAFRRYSRRARAPARVKQVEPDQQAERRVVLRKPGTTAYWKAAFHAPAFERRIVLPAARRRRGVERRRRPQHLVGRRRVAPAAQRAPVSRAGRQGPGVERQRRS